MTDGLPHRLPGDPGPAEEIAGISDALLVPQDVDAKITKLKGE